MKNTCLSVFILLLLSSASTLLAQKNVYQSKDVIKTADQIEFQYKEVLKKASNQDPKAVAQLFEFSRILDGQEAIEHAVTCLEIIPLVTDKIMAIVLEQQLSPKLKSVSLERLIKAQSLTDKADLKKPIQSWAPYTWEALNNRPVIFPGTTSADGQLSGTLKDADEPATKPADGSIKPADGSLKPADGSPKPADGSLKPAQPDARRGGNK